MDNQIIKSIKISQFEYLKANNFKFYGYKKQNVLTHTYLNNIDLIFATQSDVSKFNKFEFVSIIEDEQSFIKNITNNPIIVDDYELNKKFFLKQMFEHQMEKFIMKHYQFLIDDFKIEKFYKDFLTFKNFNRVELFNNYFFSTFSPSFWNIHSVPLDKIHKVISKKWNKDECFLFWLKFFKTRKNQINQPKNYLFVYNFINNLYGNDKDKILKFSNFFLYLRSKHEEQTIYFLEEPTLYYATMHINLKNMIHSFVIPFFESNDYYNQLYNICESLKEYYEYSSFELKRKHKNKVQITFQSELNNINDDVILEHITNYFNFIKKNQITNITKEQTIKIIMHNTLNKALYEKKPKTKPFIKI